MRSTYLTVEVDTETLAEDLVESLPAPDLIELISMIDATMADMNFTIKLVESLADVLKDEYGVAVTINIPGESK